MDKDRGRPLHGRHALVCGASGGIGAATAVALARLGCDLSLLARRQSELEKVAARCRAAGAVYAEALVADLDHGAELSERVKSRIAEQGDIHILINNATGPASGPLIQVEPEALLEAFQRHVLAAHRLTRLCVPGMESSGYGRIINVLSTSVYEPIPNLGLSNTIRGAMASWAKSLSNELPALLTINNILPGFTETPRLESLASSIAQRREISAEQVQSEWLTQVPIKRLIQPEETAEVIAFLASPAGACIRGVSLAVDGGRLKSI